MYITRAKQEKLTNNTSCFYLSNNSGSDVLEKLLNSTRKRTKSGRKYTKQLTFKAPPTLGVEQVEKEIEASSSSWMLAHGDHGRADEEEVQERRRLGVS
jgi:hypothetical protein